MIFKMMFIFKIVHNYPCELRRVPCTASNGNNFHCLRLTMGKNVPTIQLSL